MIMVLAPDKRARQAAQSRASNQQRAEKAAASAGESPDGAEANGNAPDGDAGTASDAATSAEEG
jgi:hypothetical protein